MAARPRRGIKGGIPGFRAPPHPHFSLAPLVRDLPPLFSNHRHRPRTTPLPSRLPPRVPVHPIVHIPPRGPPSFRRLERLLHALSDAPHFPYSLGVLGALVAPLVAHNERRGDEAFQKDSALVRARQEADYAAAAAAASSSPDSDSPTPTPPPPKPSKAPPDDILTPLLKDWEWRRQSVRYLSPLAKYSERYFRFFGAFPGTPAAFAAAGQSGRAPPWALCVADGDSLSAAELGAPKPLYAVQPLASVVSTDPFDPKGWLAARARGDFPRALPSPGSAAPVSVRFYHSEEAFLLLESAGWEYDAASGLLRDAGGGTATGVVPRVDGVETGHVHPGTGEAHFHGYTWLFKLLWEMSRFGRPLRFTSLSQLWIPALLKIAGFARIRPQSIQVTHYTRWVLPSAGAVLGTDEDAAAREAELEERLGMRVGGVYRRELPALTAPLRETTDYLARSLPFSSVLRPYDPASSASAASSVLYGVQTVSSDLSLAPPLLLPSYAHAGLHEPLLARSARLVHRALTTSADERSQTRLLLEVLNPQNLPLHAKVPVTDLATRQALKRAGWKEVRGGCADVHMGEWVDVGPEQYFLERGPRRTGMSNEMREELRRRRRMEAGGGGGGGGGGAGVGMGMGAVGGGGGGGGAGGRAAAARAAAEELQGVFSNPVQRG